ncbi:MAG: phosphotransferase [Simkaniaceae bacterium]|nr:phosphotransferase [Simkaniaceae bacterium]
MRYFFFLFSILHLFAVESPLQEILSALPGSSFHEVVLEKVGGGQTNQNYRATIDAKTYFIRWSQINQESLGSSLEREWICTAIASAAGLAPRVVSYFPEKRIMVSEFLKGETSHRAFPLLIEGYCDLLRTLHVLDAKFPSIFCPFDCIQQLIHYAKEVGAYLPSSLFEEVLPQVEFLQQTLSFRYPAVPCHLDLHSGNVIDTGHRLWLIDWEYAAMGDPFFDLATLASAEHFQEHMMDHLLQVYLRRDPHPEERNYFHNMRFLADVRWALWSYIQAAISPLEEPFEKYGDVFLKTAHKRGQDLQL